MNYSPLIYAFKKQNVGVTGPGLLDGQADEKHWWNWTRKARAGSTRDSKNSALPNDVKTLVEEMGNKDVPVAQRVFGSGHYLRPKFRPNPIDAKTFCWKISPSNCRRCGRSTPRCAAM